VAGVSDRELVDSRGADRRDDIVEAVIERPVPDGRAELGIVGAAERGEPGPVVASWPGASMASRSAMRSAFAATRA